MRILSLNAWGGRLQAALISYLRDADADVLCLQEVTRTPGASSEWLTYRDGDLELLQHANLLEELRRAFPRHQVFFCPAARGALHDGDEVVRSEWGLTTLVRDTHPVIGQAQDFIHGDFSAHGWGAHPRARNAHCVRIFDDRLGSAVTIAHLHGLRDPRGKGDTPAREDQALTLARLVEQLRRTGERLVVCGDFNVLPDSATFETLKRLDLIDLVTSRGYRDTRTSLYAKPQRFADYMLVNSIAQVLGFEVVEQPEVSDHRVLLLEMG